MSPKTSSTKTLSIDIETYSGNNLNECGVYKYCEAPDFEILLFGYSVDGGDVQVVDLADGEVIPPHIISLIKSDDCLKYSFNCSFERICLSRFLGMKTGEYLAPESWRCTMVASSYLGLPLSLKGVGAVLGLDEQKMEEGKELIKFFCTPVKPSKANGGVTRNLFKYNTYKRDMMIKYCKRDVEVQMNIQKRLENYPLPDWLWAEYHLDQRINDRGVFLDQELAAKAIKIDGIIHQELEKAMTEITEIDNPNSPAQIKVWLAKYGVEPEDLGKKSVAALEKEFSGNDIGDVMRLRQMLAKTSTKKYERMMSAVCSDGRIRGMFQFYGANRTGRFSSRLVQLHNLPQNKIPEIGVVRDLVLKEDVDSIKILYENVPMVLSQLIRTAFIPAKDGKFVVADYAAIEARVLAWYAGEEWRMKAFANNEDIYCSSASRMFGVPVVKNGINGDLRKKGKIAELALGYGGGAGALIAMGALDEGSGLKEDDLDPLVKTWRNANPKITRFWRQVGDTILEVVKTGKSLKQPYSVTVGRLTFTYRGSMLFIKLPSERCLSYVKPKVVINKFGSESISYEGIGDQKKWARLESYGPKFVENIVQATARDLLCHAMRNLKDYRIVMHVHDEVIIEDFDGVSHAFIEKEMAKIPEWASGLILRADGYECPFYQKD